MVIEEHAAMMRPCFDAVDEDTHHARICPRAGAQVTQHQPLIHAMSRTSKRLGIRPQAESADRNLRMASAVRKRGLRDAPNRGYREKSILPDVTHVDPQAQIHLRGGSADHDGSGASTSWARKRQHYARLGHASYDERCHKLATVAVEIFGRLGVECSKFIDQLAASVVGGGVMRRREGKDW